MRNLTDARKEWRKVYRRYLNSPRLAPKAPNAMEIRARLENHIAARRHPGEHPFGKFGKAKTKENIAALDLVIYTLKWVLGDTPTVEEFIKSQERKKRRLHTTDRIKK